MTRHRVDSPSARRRHTALRLRTDSSSTGAMGPTAAHRPTGVTYRHITDPPKTVVPDTRTTGTETAPASHPAPVGGLTLVDGHSQQRASALLRVPNGPSRSPNAVNTSTTHASSRRSRSVRSLRSTAWASNAERTQTREYPASGQAAAASGADSTLSQRPMFRRLGR